MAVIGEYMRKAGVIVDSILSNADRRAIIRQYLQESWHMFDEAFDAEPMSKEDSKRRRIEAKIMNAQSIMGQEIGVRIYDHVLNEPRPILDHKGKPITYWGGSNIKASMLGQGFKEIG